jgi:hypothetical protein
LTRTITPAIRSIYAQLHGKRYFGDFQAIGTPKQCQILWDIYQLFIRTQGHPEELDLLVLCHRYYDALLRTRIFGVDKISCSSDQAFCLAALLPDGRFSLANDVKHHCAASQFDFRCILIHVGRLASQGEADFVYVEDNQIVVLPESDDEREDESDDGASDDEVSGGGGNYDSDVSGTNDSDDLDSNSKREEGKLRDSTSIRWDDRFLLTVANIEDLMKVVGTDTINQNRDFTGEKNYDDLLG